MTRHVVPHMKRGNLWPPGVIRSEAPTMSAHLIVPMDKPMVKHLLVMKPGPRPESRRQFPHLFHC